MTNSHKTLKPLALALSPLGETAIIRAPGLDLDNPRISKFCEHHGLKSYKNHLESVTVLSNLPLEVDAVNAQYIFGGRAFHRNKKQLLIGGSDVQRYQIQASEIRSDCGEFHLVEFGAGSIRISADYFGLQNLFYYDDSDIQVVSTSYHLLLLLLRLIEVDMQLDVEKSLRMLSEENVFGSGTAIEMAHCRMNNIEESLEIDEKGLNVLVDSELEKILYDSTVEYDQASYEALIVEGRDEIVENIEMVFNYDGFDEIIVDLSGGLDSRIIFAACSVLPQKVVREKIRINTQFGPSPNAKKGGDLEFAALINSVMNYPLWRGFSDADTDYLDISDDRTEKFFYANKISRLFSTHKNFNHVVPKYSDYYTVNVARLSGFIGEVYRGANFRASHGDKMSHINNYTNYRNRYMAARPFENILSPLASKNLLKASRMYQWNHEGSLSITPEIDVLTAINPLFSLMPFYNDDLKAFFARLEPHRLLNFPSQISVSYDFVENPESTAVRVKNKQNKDSQFTLDLDYATMMLESLRGFDKSIDIFVDEFRLKGDDVVNHTNARVLSMLWSLYFQTQIIHGIGDFGGALP